jgi:hypothetical protein
MPPAISTALLWPVLQGIALEASYGGQLPGSTSSRTANRRRYYFSTADQHYDLSDD